MFAVALIPAAYLLGTFPSAALVASASGVDITATGSGNPGASNVTRTLGWRKGLLVFVLDALKGAIATLVGLWVSGRAGGYLLGGTAVLGHVFPMMRRMRGGKGVATSGGVVTVLHPLVALSVMALWLVVSRLTGKAAVASIAAVVATPIGLAITGAPAWEFAAMVALCSLLVLRHTGNIKRLLRREERGITRRLDHPQSEHTAP
jgi:glycerol-3-phosphate acyltransferase PlsY